MKYRYLLCAKDLEPVPDRCLVVQQISGVSYSALSSFYSFCLAILILFLFPGNFAVFSKHTLFQVSLGPLVCLTQDTCI